MEQAREDQPQEREDVYQYQEIPGDTGFGGRSCPPGAGKGFVPLVRQIRGFRGYYLLDGGPDVLITISMFDSADDALASNEAAAEWVRDNVLEFTKGMPEVMVGDVLIAEVS